MIAAVVVLAVFFGLAIGPAIRADRNDYHLMHRAKTGCIECEER